MSGKKDIHIDININEDITRDEETHMQFSVEFYKSNDLDIAISVFNHYDNTERRNLILKMIDTFEDSEKISLVNEINKRYIALRVKAVVGKELPLTHQLIIQHSYSTKYINSNLSKKLSEDARLLDDLVTVCRFWHLDESTHGRYQGTNIIFSINDCATTQRDDGFGKITRSYEISDIVTLMA